MENEAISLVAMRSKELWLVQERRHCQTWLEQLETVSARGMKTYSESTIKLRNLQILRKYWKRSVSQYFFSSEQPGESKSLDIALNIVGAEKTLGKLVVVVNVEAIWFEFWMKRALMRVEIFVFSCLARVRAADDAKIVRSRNVQCKTRESP